MTGQNSPESGPNGAQPAPDLQNLPDVVSSIVDTMRRGRIERLVVTKGDFHLELEARASRSDVERPAAIAADPVEMDEPEDEVATSTHTITSPMIGTFYTAPAPGEPPFVKVGRTVAQGDTIGIVEAMKIMNEIAADRGGIVAEIVAGNGEPVEYGSPLVRLDLPA
jgi:acetyl-CoA carboxylase biotin carboxyl carrier protein